MKREVLPYNPGVFPTKCAPKAGQTIEFEVEGFPPIKKARVSLRNPKNPRYESFVKLREAAIKTMERRAWYFGAVSLDISIFYKTKDELQATLSEYVGGIMDTLDGSSGVHFTYLPIVYEDDCQVVKSKSRLVKSEKYCYRVKIGFY